MHSFDDSAVRADLLQALIGTTLRAGAAVWRVFETEFEATRKADRTLVTAADHAAEAIILDDLARLAPDVPVVAEEEAAAGRIPDVGEKFFLVDPLDGTADFVRRGSDFTVNIGLIEHGEPTLGLVYAPAKSQFFTGDVRQGGAWMANPAPLANDLGQRRPIRVRTPGKLLTAVGSRSHEVPETGAYLQSLGVKERVPVGSSLKFGLVATGEADIYARASPTSEWDTAAGDAVLRAAGGRTFDIDGAPLRYGKPKFLNSGFVAVGPLEVPPIGPFVGFSRARR
jgi:3'(2'), 5'-bisphosphate nucleotidase